MKRNLILINSDLVEWKESPFIYTTHRYNRSANSIQNSDMINQTVINPVGVINSKLASSLGINITSDYLLIYGLGRYLGMQSSNEKSKQIEAFLYEGADLKSLWQTAITDNTQIRPLSVIEKLNILCSLSEIFNLESVTIISEYFPLTGDNPSRKLFNDYMKYKSLPDYILQIMENCRISLKQGIAFTMLPESILKLINRIYRSISPSKSNLIKIIDNIFFIYQSKENNINEDFFEEINTILTSDRSNEEKLHLILDTLFKKRYPEYSKDIQRIEELIHRMKLPPGIRINYPANLESDKISISLSSNKSELLSDNIQSLYEVPDSLWENIFAIMQKY